LIGGINAPEEDTPDKVKEKLKEKMLSINKEVDWLKISPTEVSWCVEFLSTMLRSCPCNREEAGGVYRHLELSKI
jgi:hypothetical protein